MPKAINCFPTFGTFVKTSSIRRLLSCLLIASLTLFLIFLINVSTFDISKNIFHEIYTF
jgi:hypothetical protein